MFNRLLTTIIFLNCLLLASVHIEIDNISSDGTVTINYESDTDIAGLQFTLMDNPDIATITGAGGGAAVSSGFTVSTSPTGTVLGFSFTGSTIPAGSGHLLDVYLNWSMVFCILKRWGKLLTISSRLEKIKIFSKNTGSQFCSLWPLMKEDWDASLRGIVCIRNLIWLELFNAALEDIPHQNTGLYLFEGLSWERAFIHAWQKNAHGRLIAVAHSTTRFWDLRLFADHRTINSTNNFPMPQADLTAITGKEAMGTYLSLGYPKQALEEIEALRYSSLLKIKNNKRESVKKETLRVLVLGDSNPYYTNHILELLAHGQKTEKISATFTIKPHPIYPVKSSDYPPLKLKVDTHPLEDILFDFSTKIIFNIR